MKSTLLRFVENNAAFDIFEFIRFNEKSDIYTAEKWLPVKRTVGIHPKVVVETIGHG